MASTKYVIRKVTGEDTFEELGTKSKRATAEQFARDARKAEVDSHIQVVTSPAGNVTLDLPAKRTINMSARYTRTVELPEGVVAPEGKRVAYLRKRAGLAVLHDPNADGEQYTVFDVKKGKELKGTFATTRAAGERIRKQAEPVEA